MAQCAILALLSTNIYSHSISCCFHFVSSGLQAKLETKALKAKRPGFTDERYHETSYYVENGKYFFPHLLLYSKYLLSHNFYSMRTRCVCVYLSFIKFAHHIKFVSPTILRANFMKILHTFH